MKNRTGIPRVAWFLVGILLIAAIVLSLGERERFSNPSASSYGPSGTRAFADLLRQRGYTVVSDDSRAPKLAKGDLVIAFYLDRLGIDPLDGELSEADRTSQKEELLPTNLALGKHLVAGGTVITFLAPVEFRSAAGSAGRKPIQVEHWSEPDQYTVTSSFTEISTTAFGGIPHGAETLAPWFVVENDADFVQVAKVGEGTLVSVLDALPAMNRFIDTHDNAVFLVRLVESVAPKGTRIVFTGATFGDAAAGSVLQAIGPWAVGAWYQILLLFIVVVVTLGVRFGLAEERRRKQQGQRELIDAISDTYRRGRMTSLALKAAYSEADAIVRKALKLPAHAADAERDSRLPRELVMAFREVLLASKDKTGSGEALRLTTDLHQKARAFAGNIVDPLTAAADAHAAAGSKPV